MHKRYAIKQAAFSDILQLASLRYQMLQEFNEASLPQDVFMESCTRTMHQFLESGRWKSWIATNDSQIVGTLWLEQVDKIPSCKELNGCWGYVTNMYVIPEYRNQGIGTALLREAKDYAKEHGYELLIVWPSDESRVFYQREGFVMHNDIHELLF